MDMPLTKNVCSPASEKKLTSTNTSHHFSNAIKPIHALTRGIVLCTVAISLSGCLGSSDSSSSPPPEPDTEGVVLGQTITIPGSAEPETVAPETSEPVTEPTPDNTATTATEPTVVTTGTFCDNTQPTHCLYPFPNDFFTTADSSSGTGKRVNLNSEAMPSNSKGIVIGTAEYNRNDGFSPGAMLIAHVPNLDLEKTGAVPVTDLERYLDADAPVIVIDADTGERQMIWAEMDDNATPEEGQALIIRPAKNFLDGHRYIVALRTLKDTSGNIIEAHDNFKVYRDNLAATDAAPESRRAHFDSLLTTLANQGISKTDLYLTWDFTVASTANISSRVLHMRDEGLSKLNGAAPSYTLTDVITPTKPVDEGEPESTEPHPTLAKVIKGLMQVPNYLTDAEGSPGSTLHYSSTAPDALPTTLTPDATLDVPFTCAIPYTALEETAGAVIVAHGLFGSQETVPRFGDLANEGTFVLCGMDWMGMSDSDLIYTASILGNIDLFPSLPDRLQQAYLNIIYLTEAMQNENGFITDENFQKDGAAIFDNSEIFFDGISQGSVLGGGLLAVSNHFKRGILNVAALNFSILLRRSDAWPTYSKFMYPEYPDTLDRNIIVAMIQMLWDRGEMNGYANHVTSDPLPGSFTKKVLIHGAVGDKTVTENGLEVLARTLEVKLKAPAIVDGRHIAVEPYFGLDTISDTSYDGSALVMWDSGPFPIDDRDGTPLRPIGNISDTSGYNSHVITFGEIAARQQKAKFMQKDGAIVDECDGGPCLADGYDGSPGVYDPANAPAEE